MPSFADNTLLWLVQFLLILTRMTSVFTLSPILGRNNIPTFGKIGLSLMTTFILIQFHPPGPGLVTDSWQFLVIAVLRELLVGFVMGFGTILFFNIVYGAGQIIDMQIGFTMSQQYDPSSGSQVAVSGSLLNLIFVECFLLADGIPTLITILNRTFDVIDVGQGVLPQAILYTALDGFVSSFILSVNVAMPVLASALLCEIALGIIVRAAPQMNVFVIGIPIKIIVGLFMLALMVPVFVFMTSTLFEKMYDTVDQLLVMMIPLG
jgi:flagellar biosynthetic protein FliR